VVHPEVRKLTDRDIDIIKDVLRASNKSGRTLQTRRMVDKTVAVVSRKMGVTPSAAGIAFLRTVVKDYNAIAGNLTSEADWLPADDRR